MWKPIFSLELSLGINPTKPDEVLLIDEASLVVDGNLVFQTDLQFESIPDDIIYAHWAIVVIDSLVKESYVSVEFR